MQTKLTPDNPYPYNRYGFLWQFLQHRSPGHHLDYGCFDGAVLRELANSRVVDDGVGVDLNAEAIERGRPCMPANVDLQVIEKGQPLPFDDDSFDSVSLLDVIEHVVDQASILNEIQRVLVPNGLLVVTVPKKHLLSVLDVGNFKFRFPRLHRAAYCLRYGHQEYQRRYIDCENGLFGDIEKEKGWHQHFKESEMTELLQRSNLGACEFDGAGFFYRPLSAILHCSPGLLRTLIQKLLMFDARCFRSANLFCVARKLAPAQQEMSAAVAPHTSHGTDN